MLNRIEFEVTRQAPSPDHCRRDGALGPNIGLARGHGGADDFVVGMTHGVAPVGGFRALQKGVDPTSPRSWCRIEYVGGMLTPEPLARGC